MTPPSPAQRAADLANVVSLPARRAVPVVRRRVTGRYEVDDWGRDPELVRLAGRLAWMRWSINVGGAEHLRHRRGTLVVTNARRFALTPVMVAFALGRELERPVRFVGHSDAIPTGPWLRRVGALLDHPKETAGALRAGEVVVVGTSPSSHQRHAGEVPLHHIEAASAAGAIVHAAAAISSPISRHARVEVGTAIRNSTRRRGPLAEVEMADHVHDRLQHLLDGIGGAEVLDWIGET
jgi:hypothetical protein